MADDHNPEIFLLGQQLLRLKDGLSADERKTQVCGSGYEKKFWEFRSRDDLCSDLLGVAPPQRVGLVCDAGLGKTTNMAWIQAQLARGGGRQMPLLLRLDAGGNEGRAGGVTLLEKELNRADRRPLLRWLVQEMCIAGAGGKPRALMAALQRLQAQGRITLLLDGLDHASNLPTIKQYLQRLFASAHWQKCPIWVAGRPTAFETRWRDLFAGPHWQFLRVAPLAEAEIRFYMTQRAGGDWYETMPQQGRSLLTIPRFLQLICGIIRGKISGLKEVEAKQEAIHRLKLNTGADVYCRAFFELGDEGDPNPDLNTLGLLLQGLHGAAARLGLPRGEDPDWDNRGERVEKAAALLGAIAFEMLDPTNGAAKFSGVKLNPFRTEAAKRFAAARAGTTGQFKRWFRLLREMNVHALDFLLFREANERRLAFRDRTTLAFFAAYWACRHEKLKKLDVTRQWVVDALFLKNQDFYEFWQFAAEMPIEDLPVGQDGGPNETRWLALFRPLYDGSIQDAKKRPIRSTEFIYRSWDRMTQSQEGQRIIAEEYRARTIPRELVEGFIALVKQTLPQDNGTFNMGDEDQENPRTVTHFCLHKFCVTNLDYERFDPRHQEQRWDEEQHPVVEKLGDRSADDTCPVVVVSWYDAICYARWLGSFVDAAGRPYEIVLPGEAQWEYACRAGRRTMYTFDEAHPGQKCTSVYCNFDAKNYPDEGEKPREYRACTLPVSGTVPEAWQPLNISPVMGPNRWGFFQMHGNVWEWCEERWGKMALARVLRGGSWIHLGRLCRSAYRDWSEPGNRYLHDGFRLAAVPCGAFVPVGAKSGQVGEA